MENIYFDLKRLKYLGVGAIIGKTVRIRRPEECVIGDGAIIDDFAYISCDIEIGKHCHVGSHVNISGGGKFTMDDYAGLSNHCSVHAASSDYAAVSMDLPSAPEEEKFGGTSGEVSIGRYAIIGAHSCVLPGVNIPDACAFGAYSLIKPGDYRPLGLYVGVPARFKGYRKVPKEAPEWIQDLSTKLILNPSTVTA